MKSVVVIGSSISCKTVKQLNKEEYSLLASYTSVNPLSLIKEERSEYPFIKTNSEAYISDAKKSIFSEIKEMNPDIIVMDLLDCRLNVNEYELNDGVFYCTESNGFKTAVADLNCNVLNTINPYVLSEKDWIDIFNAYYNKLKEACPKAKIILLECKPAVKYLSKNNKIYNLYKVDYAVTVDKFYDKIYTLFNVGIQDVSVVPGVDIYFCDEKSSLRAFSFDLQPEYYEYALKAIELIINGAEDYLLKINALHTEYKNKSVQRYKLADLHEKVWKDIELTSFCGVYEDDFGNCINTNGCIVDISLRGQQNKINIGKKCKISGLKIIVSNQNSVTIRDGANIWAGCLLQFENNNTFGLGTNTQLQNAYIVCKSNNKILIEKDNKLIRGANIGIDNNCDFSISSNNLIWNIELHMFDSSKLKIGNNNFFNKNCLLTMHIYTETIIGNDLIIASDVQIINGDGHSVFDLNTGKKVNDMRDGHNVIRIKDHVWLCRRSMILSDVTISEGCIVAAGALCKKIKAPNNCLLAGVPAKVKKKNVCWTKNNSTTNIKDCEPYTRLTQEESEE